VQQRQIISREEHLWFIDLKQLNKKNSFFNKFCEEGVGEGASPKSYITES
jgi:hypothetical protein